MVPAGYESVETALRMHLEDLAWLGPDETLGLKRLYAQISLCLKEVLKCTLGSRDSKDRVWAFKLLEGTAQSRKLILTAYAMP